MPYSYNNYTSMCFALRDLALRKGFSQKQVAQMCGLAENQISRVFRAKSPPSATTLCLIADRLGAEWRLACRISPPPEGTFVCADGVLMFTSNTCFASAAQIQAAVDSFISYAAEKHDTVLFPDDCQVFAHNVSGQICLRAYLF